jgi:hypothetical protein
MMTKQIAIVGMACRFPGHVQSPDDFWALLRDEKDAVTQVPADRFGTEFYQHPLKREAGKSYTFAAGVLDDVAGFDADFFGISPREAQQMDPQQRLLLELAWETFEDAGVRPRDMEGSNCAVYIGVASPDYGNRFVDDLNAVDPYSATGNTLSIASNRLSYLFDLRGPSVSVDTACSSSLVALHQACQALQSGDAEMALAGGVNLLLHPFGFVTFSKALPRVRRERRRLCPLGRRRAGDAEDAGARARRRRHDPRGDRRIGRQLGRLFGRRHQRAGRGHASGAAAHGLRPRGRRSALARLCRGAWHRHGGRRPDRSARAHGSRIGGKAGRPAVADRFGEDQRRPP